MFIHRPSEQVREAAESHLHAPVDLVVPVSWGLGLSTSGILTLAGAYVVLGTVAGTFGTSWLLAVLTSLPLAWILVQATRGNLGRGLLVMTAKTESGRQVVALRAKRFAVMTTKGEVYRSYPGPTFPKLLPDEVWWQGLTCQIGDDLYYINHNYEEEVRQAIPTASRTGF